MTEPANLAWIGHGLYDVGLAGMCALCGRSDPRELTLEDLDTVSDFIEKHYFSGALDPYLSVVFTNNSGYAGPNKVKRPEDYAEVFRPHRVLPKGEHLDVAGGVACVLTGKRPAIWVHRQHVPLFSAKDVMNFRPNGQGALPLSAPALLALQFVPMASRRSEGRMLSVHADAAWLTLAFARKYLDDNRRILALPLPTERAQAFPAFDREIPMWDATKKRYKMADAKGPRSLVVTDLIDVGGRSAPSDLDPGGVPVTVYLLSNAGQGPSLEIFDLPAGAVSFAMRAAGAKTAQSWKAIAERFRPVKDLEADGGSPRKLARGSDAAIPGRPGWTRNPAFEELVHVFEAGFTDRGAACQWLRRHVLGRIESSAGKVTYEETRARQWALAELFLVEVMTMKRTRIDAVRSFADKVAEWINEKNDRKLYRALAFDRPWELRQTLLGVQRESAKREDGPIFGLDEYATVWLGEDGTPAEEALARDLVAIRVVERLHALGYYASHPEETLEAGRVEEST